MIRSLTAAGGAPDKMISPITPEQAALYEIHSSWWAQWVFWSWGQDLAGSYFAWKVRRKWKRYRKSVTAHNEIALRKLGWTVAGAVLLLLGGCEQRSELKGPSSTVDGSVHSVIINSHRYIVWESVHAIPQGAAGGICHDEACPNPIHQCPPCQ